MGLLSERSFSAIDDFYFAKGMYLNDRYNLGGLMDWERSALTGYFPVGSHIGLIGAGAGREVFGLESLGYRVTATEVNPKLVTLGNRLLEREGVAARILLAGRDAIPSGPFDGFLVGWGAFSNVRTQAARRMLLETISHELPAKAPLLVSFLVRGHGDDFYSLQVRIANPLRRLRRRSPIEPGDHIRPVRLHSFTLAEASAELLSGGFVTELVEEFPYGHAVARRQ